MSQTSKLHRFATSLQERKSNDAGELLWLKGLFQPSAPNIRYWQEAQTLCRVVSQRLSDAQSQTESLEIKYSKAKRLVREYQGRYLPGVFSSSANLSPLLFFTGTVSFIKRGGEE